jgi:hypothetical protein
MAKKDKTEAKAQKRYRVIFTHLRDANGGDHFNGEILTAEEIGNWETHLSRGAIEEVVEEVAGDVEEAAETES